MIPMKTPSPNTANLFNNIQAKATDEQVDVLLSTPQCRIERIVSMGHHSVDDFWYQQSEDEWVLLVQGGAVLRYQQPDELITMVAGDYYLIPAHRPHRVESTDDKNPTIWLAIFLS
jgi:cupin 2 domain-containing protein